MGGEKIMKLNEIVMGVCYYPEHWDESLWESDLRRMLDTGISVIRIAEFAWSKFEPEEGEFTFEFFDRFMAAAEKTPIKVIFCTPTATPPAWATHNYPEILNVQKDGVSYRHGHRRHYNYNSPKYRELTAAVVAQIAAHYGSHPSIIGWQIDNEFNCEENEFYSDSDTAAFRLFLRKKYGDVGALNKAWGNVFWNQEFTSWEQVYVPRPTSSGHTNPHQQLDYLRFVSDSCVNYAGLQSRILRAHIRPGAFITTNGLFGNVDNHRQTDENLDFMTYDSYPNFAFCMSENPRQSADLNDRKWSRNLAEARSISPVFGVMEQQSGPNGWNCSMEAPAPKPGQMTLWSLQSVAHGADFVSYFRWRTCTFGTEIYWHGILEYDNRDNRRLREAADIAKKFKAIGELADARYQAAFAVVKEYDNVWDAQYDAWHRRVDGVSQAGWFRAAQLTHTPMDYLYITERTGAEDLARYPLLVYPHATMLSVRTAVLLENYVAAGGKLVVGCRTGYKDLNGHCVMTPKPGLLSRLCGADVTDCTFVGPADDAVYADWDGERLEAAVYNDILAPLGGAEVLARFGSNYYEGEPALVRNRHGKGECYYFGGAFGRETAAAFLRRLAVAGPYAGIVSLPECCEIAVREKDGVKYIFVLNFSDGDAVIKLRKDLRSLYTGAVEKGSVTLKKYETRVYKLNK